jgi:hypothetical protein
MPNRLKRFYLSLSFLDLFQQNISLKLYNRSRISIALGKFLSLIIYAFLLYNFAASDMITKSNPIVLQNSMQSLQRPTMEFTNENFIIAFAVVDSFNVIQYDPTIFRLLFSLFFHNLFFFYIIVLNLIINSQYFSTNTKKNSRLFFSFFN